MTGSILPIRPQPQPQPPRKKHSAPRPAKPYPHFPLTAHPSGQWCKKIRGKVFYFGAWAEPTAALKKYLDQKDDLHAGRVPRAKEDGFTVRDLCLRFLTEKKNAQEAGELTARSYGDYARTCERIARAFGSNRLAADLHPADFAKLRDHWARAWAAGTIVGEIQRVRVLFKWAYDARLLAQPMVFGPGFKRPARHVLRRARAKKGPQMFEPEEIEVLLKAAGVQLRAMILLGINSGFGNADCGKLPLAALDLAAGWIRFPRPKTGIDRRCPLWPETIEALREAQAKRPTAKEHAAELVFLTRAGDAWFKDSKDNPISKEFAKLLKATGLPRGRNFYALRHTFETVAGDGRDQVAVDFLMGHAREDMAAVYRERIADQRLQALVAHVHLWLYGR